MLADPPLPRHNASVCRLLTVSHDLQDSSLPDSTPPQQDAQRPELGFSQYEVIRLYYTTDHLGSIRELVDGDGTIRARYEYGPYGKRTKLDGDLDADFGFTGHYTHDASDLVLAQYRGYDPSVGRWLSRDPIEEEGGINLYGYVWNGPICAIDPLGLKEKGQLENAKSTVKVCNQNGSDTFKVKSLGELTTLMGYIRTLPQGTYSSITIAGHGSTVGSTVLSTDEMHTLADLLDDILTKDAKVYLNGCETNSDAQFLSTLLPGRTISGNENGAASLGGVTTIRDPRHPLTPKNEKSFKDGNEVPRSLP